MSELMPEKPQENESKAEIAFQVFCAVIFLSMIGLVFWNAMLRYIFKASFAPSEEWARILFIYITFFGSIEGFYRGRHIAVDMVTSLLTGITKKAVDVVAQLFALAALVLLFLGGISLVEQTIDTATVATGLNMAFVNGTLPAMALAVIIIRGRELLNTLKKPACEFVRIPKEF
ncbi:TRAP transporter small permease [Propionivibrio dicarboxylicus]|uniref:TRAP transporter small permease protein n=1 Tax=Propionivibrio dicarboxylicus TaxID=83767 RepID=A0A1G8E634_9RHOO|nr:TRAP transporter small permease subunit [Propionivibrio dicarboxylicus]SDH65363.1 TRAP-type C4-dicarboxylate transport system, small permease component [Propionivibrio dicarboxylicus]